MNIAFSTIACPNWTLEETASKAAELGYLGVELRSFYDQSVYVVSDPFGRAPSEIQSIFADAGVTPI
ncbi:MAG: hypothetical protein KUG81_07145, partial [Gammaproteobacteria bacterium]|nr:hypothetical protein [Gammaproteobacteria bacterium]